VRPVQWADAVEPSYLVAFSASLRGVETNRAVAGSKTNSMRTRGGHWAALCGVLWLLGFDVVPLAHMVLHEALEEHHHRHAHAHPHDDQGDEEPRPSEHGEGSVAHRDLAANVPVPGVPAVLEALLAVSPPEPFSHDEQPADRQPRTSRARAPPLTTA